MRWLVIVLFLVSFGSVSMAEEDIVFYCDVERIVKVKHGKPIEENWLWKGKAITKFKFQLTPEEIVFGSGKGYFGGTRMPIISRISDKSFEARDSLWHLHHRESQLTLTYNFGHGMVLVGSCSKF